MKKLLLIFSMVCTGCSFQVPDKWLESRNALSPAENGKAQKFSYQYVEEFSPGVFISSDSGGPKISTKTTLDAEGLRIQSEKGCIFCHPR